MSNILITGCSSGFGLDAAKDLAARGHTVYATMRGVHGKNAAVAQELASYGAENGYALHVGELDVTSDASVVAAVDDMVAKTGSIDVVVNNAGQMFVGITEAFTSDDLARQLDINVVGPFRLCRAALPGMRKQGSGLVVNVSSIAGRLAVPFFGVYHASKWGLEGLSESLRYELSGFGVEVVLVQPGPFTTNLFPRSPRPTDHATEEQYGELNQVLEGMSGAFEEVFEDPEAPTDPQLVVDAIVELVEMEPGTRPLRTVVGLDFGGARPINESTDPHRLTVLENMGMLHMDQVKTD
jgi:NAD(P)-dependent dehydrogenase (short-subunit alcohol dehydrogenase family)